MSETTNVVSTANLSPWQTIVISLALGGLGGAGLQQVSLPDLERRIDILERDSAVCKQRLDDVKEDINALNRIIPAYSLRKRGSDKTVNRGPAVYRQK